MARYAAVGCAGCGAVWIVDGEPATTACPRCRKRHRFGELRRFAESDDKDRVRDVRTSILADRSDGEGGFVSFGGVDRDVEEG